MKEEIIYYLKWMYRLFLAAQNKFLIKMIPIEKLKEVHVKRYYHREITIGNPQKLNEKILWLEYHTDSELRSRLTDKYEVRQYVADKGYEQTLVPIYGVWHQGEAIDFTSLPEQFVLKATHGCDMNYICRSKNEEEIRKMKRRVSMWMKTNIAYISLESHYLSIKPGIICEQYLDSGKADIVDYKFHCSDGKARFVLVCTDRSHGQYRNVFDMEWNPLHVVTGAKENPEELPQPEKFQEMIRMAEDLAQEIPFVRVDLYEVNGKIYFGEMTFTPATGVLFHFNDEFLLEQGRYCTIGEEKKTPDKDSSCRKG